MFFSLLFRGGRRSHSYSSTLDGASSSTPPGVNAPVAFSPLVFLCRKKKSTHTQRAQNLTDHRSRSRWASSVVHTTSDPCPQCYRRGGELPSPASHDASGRCQCAHWHHCWVLAPVLCRVPPVTLGTSRMPNLSATAACATGCSTLQCAVVCAGPHSSVY